MMLSRDHSLQTARLCIEGMRGDVDKDTLEYDEIGRHQNGNSNQTGNPVNGGASGPSEHEVARGQSQNCKQGGHQSMFRASKTILLDVRDQIVDLVNQEDDEANDASDTNREKGESNFPERKPVDWWIHKGENFKETVVYSIGEGCVDVGEGNCWVLDENLDWLDKGIPEDF